MQGAHGCHAHAEHRGVGDPCMVDDVGADAAGMHAHHVHRRAGHFVAQGFGKPADRKLGRVVGALRGHRDQTKDAGNVDDRRFGPGLQVRQEGLGAVHHAPEINPHDPFEVLVTHPLDRV